MPWVGLKTSAPGMRADAMPVLIAATTQADAKTAGIRRLRKGMARPCPGVDEDTPGSRPEPAAGTCPVSRRTAGQVQEAIQTTQTSQIPAFVGQCRKVETAAFASR